MTYLIRLFLVFLASFFFYNFMQWLASKGGHGFKYMKLRQFAALSAKNYIKYKWNRKK